MRPVSWRLFGVPFWAPRVFGILLELMGLELARPFRGPFLGREAARVFPCFLCLVFVSPLLFCFAASHVLLEGPPINGSTYGRPGALDVPPLARVRARGCPSRAEGWSPPCAVFVFCLVFGFGSQGPRRIAPRAFCLEGVPFSGCSLGSHTHVLSPAPGFFFVSEEQYCEAKN